MQYKNDNTTCHRSSAVSIAIGVREGILLGGRKKFALKMTIRPENNNLPQK